MTSAVSCERCVNSNVNNIELDLPCFNRMRYFVRILFFLLWSIPKCTISKLMCIRCRKFIEAIPDENDFDLQMILLLRWQWICLIHLALSFILQSYLNSSKIQTNGQTHASLYFAKKKLLMNICHTGFWSKNIFCPCMKFVILLTQVSQIL